MGGKRSSKSGPPQEMGLSHRRSSSARVPVIRLIQFKPTHVVHINAVDFRSTVQGLTGRHAPQLSSSSNCGIESNNKKNGYPDDERSGSDQREPSPTTTSPCSMSETSSASADIMIVDQRDLSNSWASDSSSGTCSGSAYVDIFDGLCTTSNLMMLMEAESASATTCTAGRRLLEELQLATTTATTTDRILDDIDDEDDHSFFLFLTNILAADPPTT